VLQLLYSPFAPETDCFLLKEMIAWRYTAIINAYEDSPDLQFYYQSHLKAFHEKTNNLPEAAAVALETAQCALRRIRIGYQETCKVDHDEVFVEMTRAASELYEKAGFAERAINAEHSLAEYHTEKHNYVAAAEAYTRIASLTRQVDGYETNKKNKKPRSLGTYYRVEFFGTRQLNRLREILPPLEPKVGGLGWGKELKEGFVAIAGAERPQGSTRFVFREAKITRIMEICERLRRTQDLLAEKANKPVKVRFLQKQGEERDLKSNELGIRVTKVDPVSDPLPAKQHKFTPKASSRYLSMCECRRFVFETPFTKSGKAHGSTKDQWMRRTTCYVKERFPCREKIQAIVKEVCEELAPIQVSTNMIKHKIQDLQREAFPNSGVAKLKTLYQVLSGSVNTQVHGGVTEVAAAFLPADTVRSYSVEDVRALRTAIIKFLQVASGALRVARRLLQKELNRELKAPFDSGRGSADQSSKNNSDSRFQEVLEDSFKRLKNEVQKYLEISERYVSGYDEPGVDAMPSMEDVIVAKLEDFLSDEPPENDLHHDDNDGHPEGETEPGNTPSQPLVEKEGLEVVIERADTQTKETTTCTTESDTKADQSVAENGNKSEAKDAVGPEGIKVEIPADDQRCLSTAVIAPEEVALELSNDNDNNKNKNLENEDQQPSNDPMEGESKKVRRFSSSDEDKSEVSAAPPTSP